MWMCGSKILKAASCGLPRLEQYNFCLAVQTPPFAASGAVMPRTSRSVAQRLAAQQGKSKKRRAPRTGTPAPAPSAPAGPSVDQILDEVVPSEAGPRAASTPALAPPPTPAPTRRASNTVGAAARRAAGRSTVKAAPVRRRYSEYAVEYQYVWADLRRILLVAGLLVVLLVVLSFFIE
jgi:hypothetical protein